ncbi:AMIN domain-containing protein, partial [Desulfococcaceae bacterium HSG8]|nr:AMIN domain-containing protein [Desulfococcaceae bacterium HSG8]
MKKNLKVFVGADGSIRNYRSFTIGSPARIVFDIFNIKSPYKSEKRVPVNSRWVKRVRYYGYPDRLRLVLDTEKEYLSAFSAHPVEEGLVIYVGEGVRLIAEKPAGYSPPEPSAKKAKQLRSVYATQMEDSMIITIKGDGAITDYKSSVIENPPTIVVDVPNIEGRYEDHEFPVDSKWVRKVRYSSYPDKVRFFIDTEKTWLSDFSAYPDKNGLVIHVGKSGKPGIKSRESFAASGYEPGEPAWVDLIAFAPEDAGKSSLILETSRPVKYEVNQTADKKLELRLFNTKIPGYRYEQGPLITTRFESAVNQVTPVVQEPGAGNVSVLDIDLREAVPYFVEQTGESGEHLLMVHFEASSLPPHSLEIRASESAQKPAASDTVPEIAVKSPAQDYGKPQETASLPDQLRAELKEGPEQPPPAGMAPPAEMAPAPPVTPGEFSGGIPLPSSAAPEAEDFGAVAEEKKYTGEPIALDFFET